jgi:hypothetical protein
MLVFRFADLQALVQLSLSLSRLNLDGHRILLVRFGSSCRAATELAFGAVAQYFSA